MTAGHEERLWMSILHRYPPFVWLHPPISASSRSSLISLWQPLGILGNRLVYSTFHHISYWIIHLTISMGQKGGEDELEYWGEGGKGKMSEWTRIYTSCSSKLIIEIWSASHILWLLEERVQCACLAKIRIIFWKYPGPYILCPKFKIYLDCSWVTAAKWYHVQTHWWNDQINYFPFTTL